MIQYTSTYWKVRHMTKRIKVVQGGQGAGKNVAICQILFEDGMKHKDVTTVMSDTYDNLKDGAISDFENVFESVGLAFGNYYNKSTKDVTLPGGGLIQFRYISDTKKEAGKSKRRQKLYINEANKIGWETAERYIGRTHGDVYIDYNPDYEFWAHTQVPHIKDKEGNSISEQIIVTYLDNELIPESELQYILSRKDNKDWFRVYGLGQTGFYSDRLIYKYEFFDELPADAKRVPSGMDFGLSPDPTILVDLWVKDNKLYADEVFCENGLMPEKIRGAERMAIVDKMEEVGFKKGWLIVGDSSARDSIVDMRKYGYNIHGVSRPPGSQIEGIKKVKSYDLLITRRSENIKKGCESWFFKVDHNGKIVPEPDGHEPDGLAAIRYAMSIKPKRVTY